VNYNQNNLSEVIDFCEQLLAGENYSELREKISFLERDMMKNSEVDIEKLKDIRGRIDVLQAKVQRKKEEIKKEIEKTSLKRRLIGKYRAK